MSKASNSSLTERLVRAYKQSVLMILVWILYFIVAVIIGGIGGAMLFSGLGNNSVVMIIFGAIIAVIGYLLFIISFFAAFIYSASRGEGYKTTLGIVEAYMETIKLIVELAVVLVIGLILYIIGYAISGGIGAIFYFFAFIIFILFPLAAQFYVIDYLKRL